MPCSQGRLSGSQPSRGVWVGVRGHLCNPSASTYSAQQCCVSPPHRPQESPVFTFSRSWGHLPAPPWIQASTPSARCLPLCLCLTQHFLKAEVTPGGDSAPRGHGAMSGDDCGWLLVLSGWGPGMLLHGPQRQGQTPMSALPRVEPLLYRKLLQPPPS